jgi:hypothetical protein
VTVAAALLVAEPLPELAPVLEPVVLELALESAFVPVPLAAASAAAPPKLPPPPPPPPPPHPVSAIAPNASKIALLCATFNKKHLQDNKRRFLRAKRLVGQTFLQMLSPCF